jgi:DNA polymerase
MEDYKRNKLKEALIFLKYLGFEEIYKNNPDTSTIEDLIEEVKTCTKCKLHRNRTNAVFGDGSFEADLMLIGEAPGEKEDEIGLPFVGAAGRELDIILELADIDRKEIFITNVVKCRPPGNRNPKTDEIAACNRYLREQIKMIDPKVIILLGNVSLYLITGVMGGITKSRGQKMEYFSRIVIPSFHPAYVIRNPNSREIVVKDFKEALRSIK